ncbi:hypothetical protein CPJ18_19430 [Agrobacterium rosae]|nr:hypothetical protein DXM21_03540 [Agrobacterium rosae]KAA3524840.1 hypothetical protein DXM25_03540 [Agrobacterium rosae]MQB47251.1 hypothetical protein [Agrobacterium rosae]POO50518.1 hypothetical protein CPJ18_19430 [Agrobacterium rosae]
MFCTDDKLSPLNTQGICQLAGLTALDIHLVISDIAIAALSLPQASKAFQIGSFLKIGSASCNPQR